MRLGDAVRTVDLPLHAPPDQIGPRFAAGVRAAIADLRAHGLAPAALLVDTVFSSDGVLTDPPGFVAEAVADVRAAGGVLIADEVQAGFGRSGDAFWGFARHGLVPEIVSMGKPMGNGHPVAGVAVQPAVLKAFGDQCRYFNTFGGNPVAMAAAGAVLDVLQQQGLQANAQRVGALLRDGLRGLAANHRCIGQVRGAGLFIALDLVQPDGSGAPDAALTARVVNGLRERGVLLSATGQAASALKIRPPLVFEPAHATLLVDTLDRLLADLAA
jgi:4-aminobutyrate aminotransferase-like enzyme